MTRENYNITFNASITSSQSESAKSLIYEGTSNESFDIENVNLGGEEYLKRIEKLKEVDEYIELLKKKSSHENFPSYSIVSYAEIFWLDLQSEFEDTIPVPVFSLGLDGSILITIKKDEHYLEIEVTEEGYELYYEDNDTGENDLIEVFHGMSIMEAIGDRILMISI